MKIILRSIPIRTWITSGLLFLFGLLVFFSAQSYDIGSLRTMGPGYFPTLLGGALCTFSLLILIEDVATPRLGRVLSSPLSWRSVISVCGPLGGILAFALTIKSAGFVPATLLCASLAGLGHPMNRMFEIAIISVLISAFSTAVFVFALGIPVRLFVF